MESKKVLKSTALATGTVLIGSLANVQAADLFSAEDLGTGAELRSELIVKNNPLVEATSFLNNSDIELKCGEGKCGEGKCGEGKEKKAEKGKESKTSEHKCGEGKCGEGKEKKAEKSTKESKSSEHKCGEGKCGGK